MLNELRSDLETTKDLGKLAKLKHVQACLMPESQYLKSAGFDEIELDHHACAGLRLADVSLSTTFLGKRLKAPLMIAPMTGGVEFAATLNQRWARAAEEFGLAFGVGSQRLMLKDERLKETFDVRRHAPTALLFANLGAAQITGADGVELAMRAVSSIEADALFLHLNPLQEACQERGNTDFSAVLHGISAMVKRLRRESIPVLVREVGFGLGKHDVVRLLETGIDGLDCAGAGGTSWTKVEALGASDERFRKLGMVFGEWGIPTVLSIKNVRTVNSAIPLIATGGLRSGLDVAKAIALGADLGAMAAPMLKAAVLGEKELAQFIEQILLELRVAMFATGTSNVEELKGSLRCSP